MPDTRTQADDLALRCALQLNAAENAAALLGIKVVDAREGYAHVEMKVTGDMLNGHGICHGGLIFTVADSAFAYACNSRNQVGVAQQCSINFISPVKAGETLTAKCSERALAGRSGVYDATITGEDGRTVAEFRGLARIVQGQVIKM